MKPVRAWVGQHAGLAWIRDREMYSGRLPIYATRENARRYHDRAIAVEIHIRPATRRRRCSR